MSSVAEFYKPGTVVKFSIPGSWLDKFTGVIEDIMHPRFKPQKPFVPNSVYILLDDVEKLDSAWTYYPYIRVSYDSCPRVLEICRESPLKSKSESQEEDWCPQCGSVGEFVALAFKCPKCWKVWY